MPICSRIINMNTDMAGLLAYGLRTIMRNCLKMQTGTTDILQKLHGLVVVLMINLHNSVRYQVVTTTGIYSVGLVPGYHGAPVWMEEIWYGGTAKQGLIHLI